MSISDPAPAELSMLQRKRNRKNTFAHLQGSSKLICHHFITNLCLLNIFKRLRFSCNRYFTYLAIYYKHRIICIVFYVSCFVHCLLCIVIYAWYYMHCIVCIVLFALYSMHCILVSVSCKA